MNGDILTILFVLTVPFVGIFIGYKTKNMGRDEKYNRGRPLCLDSHEHGKEIPKANSTGRHGRRGDTYMENRFAKYIELAKKYKMVNAQIITPDDIVFDIRAILKCRWGCNDFFKEDVRCHSRNTSLQERMAMIKKYRSILLLHSHNARDISIAALKIEREAFNDGYYFAFAMRFCNFCETCSVESTGVCQFPEKVRPCDQSFGMDIFATARKLGLPCEVLAGHEDTQNRFGLVLID